MEEATSAAGAAVGASESDKRLALFCSPSCSLFQQLCPQLTKTKASVFKRWRARCSRGCGQSSLEGISKGDVIKRRHRRRAPRGKSDDCHRTGASAPMLPAANDFCHASGATNASIGDANGADVLVKHNCRLERTCERQHHSDHDDEANSRPRHKAPSQSASIECADSEGSRKRLTDGARDTNELELKFRGSRARDRDDGGTKQHLAPTIGQQAVSRPLDLVKLVAAASQTSRHNRPTIKSEATSGCQIMTEAASRQEEACTKKHFTVAPYGGPLSVQAARKTISTYLAVSSSNHHKHTMMIKRSPRRSRKSKTYAKHKRRDRNQTATSDKKWPLRRSPAALSYDKQMQVPDVNHHQMGPKQKASGPIRASFVVQTTRVGALFLFLTSMLLAAAVSNSSSATRRTTRNLAQDDHKLELWRSLVQSLYAPQGQSTHRSATQAGANIRTSQLELLAERLTRWPDQRRAALFFIDQLARRLESVTERDDDDDDEGEAGGQFCRQISWAQLSEPSTSGAHSTTATTHANSVSRQVTLERLASNRKLTDHLNGQAAASGQAARLALDSANLISRLLMTGGTADDEHGGRSTQADSRLSSNFFGSFLAAFKSPDTSGDRETGSEDEAHVSRSQVEREAEDAIKDTHNLELLLNRLVTAKFLRYLLAMKLREHATRTSALPASRLLHSMGTIMLEDEAQASPDSHDTLDSDEQSIGQMRVSFASVAQLQQHAASASSSRSRSEPSIKFVDWLASANGGGGGGGGGASRKSRLMSELPFERAPSFIAHWILADSSGKLNKLKIRLATSGVTAASKQQMEADRQQQLELADGEWFSPEFNCAQGARWLLTYSVPIFAHANNGSIRFRGVSFVSLDVAQSGPLINQCATSGISLLANTNQCRTRLVGSQCVSLTGHLQLIRNGRGAQFRPGAYACQCPTNWPHLGPASRTATLQRRKELIELLAGRASNDKSQSDPVQQQQQQRRHHHDAVHQSALQHDELDQGGDLSFIGFPATASEEQQQQEQQQQTGSLNDKRLVAQVLAANWRRNSTSSVRNAAKKQHERPAYFALGSQLESEAALEWLAGGQTSPPPAARRICQLCREARENGESLAANGKASDCESSSSVENNVDPAYGNPFSGSLLAADIENNPLSWLRPLVLIVQSVCLVINLGLICVILRIRKSRLIIVSGWLMLETMLIGAVLLHTSILVRYFQPTSLTCLLEPWFRELGFSIFYGSILIKLYRILTEFQTRKAHRVCLRDKDQIIYLLAIVFIVIGYMSAWTALMVDGFFVSSEPEVAFDVTTNGAASFNVSPDILSRIERQTEAQTVAHRGASFVAEDLDRFNDPKNQKSVSMRLNLSPSGGTGAGLPEQHRPGMSGLYAMLAGTSGLPLGLPPPSPQQTIPLDHLATGANLNAKLFLATKEPDTDDSKRSARSAAPSLSSQLALRKAAAAAANNNDDNDEQEDRDQGKVHKASGTPNVHEPQHYSQAQESHWPAQSSKQSSDDGESSAGNSAASLAGEHLEILARGLNSFGELFLGLLESEQQYEPESDTLVYLIRCRKLTWDYVTESSEIALLLFGVHLVYKLRNASMEVHKEKFILSVAIFIELLISSSLYLVRHTLWHKLTGDHLLILYSIRCQLTVTLTVALVFGPQLWQIGKSKPSLLLSALFNYSFHQYNDHSSSDCGPSGGSSSGATSGASGAGATARGKRGNSTRHRCHISCEVHDHHLGDASRLQQAMLSNSALEIGSINLADMDPDEIQAELKRVYTQLELLKTKVMRRDNPHISKRRGGRKPGHRKFSLQAFHNRHNSSSEQHHAAPATTGQPNESAGSSCEAGEQVGLLAAARQAQQQTFACSNQYPSSSTGTRLPALAELEGETSSNYGEQRVSKSLLGKRPSGGTPNSSGKHVRVDDTVREYTDDRANHQTNSDHKLGANERFKAPSLTSKLIGRSKAKKQQPQQQQNSRCSSNSKWTPEMPSTSSLGLDDEAMMALNDSQSSGEVTPQHRSSIVYSSSYHNEEHSSIN